MALVGSVKRHWFRLPAHSKFAFNHIQHAIPLQATTEKLRMMMLALGDARVMLVVLAHHLAQARNLECMPARERMEFVLSTEALYAPLANRLGVWSVKSDLEDLCFKVCASQTAVGLCARYQGMQSCFWHTLHLSRY